MSSKTMRLLRSILAIDVNGVDQFETMPRFLEGLECACAGDPTQHAIVCRNYTLTPIKYK